MYFNIWLNVNYYSNSAVVLYIYIYHCVCIYIVIEGEGMQVPNI